MCLLGSISLQIWILKLSIYEWPQIKIYKCMTFTAQLHLLATLKDVNVRKCWVFSIFEKLFNMVIGYGSFTRHLLKKG